MTVLEAAAALREGKLSSVDLTLDCLQLIKEWNPRLNAFQTITAERALEDARRADRELAAGADRGVFHGIPIAHKDLFCTKGILTTSGSKVFGGFVPREDAAVVERFAAAGAVLLGKTAMHEHAFGITSNNPHYGAVRNPWDLERIPGGSSGGSGAAVAAGLALLATGSDTGGSIRVPASYCGVVGLKPTFGLVSKRGALPLGFSLDTAGPLAATVRDAAAALNVMAGHDPLDPSSAKRPFEDYMPPERIDLTGLTIGLPRNFFFEKLDPQVDNAVHLMAYVAQDLGATLREVRVPDGEQLNAIAQICLLAEAASVHEPYLRKQRSAYGEDVRALLDMGRLIPATDYLQAQRLRRRMLKVYSILFREVDCLFVPCTPMAAPLIGQNQVLLGGEMEDVRLATTRLVRGVNALGLPALAMPAGQAQGSLPLGLQIIGPAWSEARLLRIGAALEDRIGVSRAPLSAARAGQANTPVES
ncbi:MAG: amidase [Bryobacteraceae bacterium]|jgi:aspartyl-tRNA(Asn)/glutamyl-tRNA(Gln) amidotransferase subunit A|nr:amidase [Bryobacteraceae bacterium]